MTRTQYRPDRHGHRVYVSDQRSARERDRRYATVAGQWQQPADTQQTSALAGEPVYLPAKSGGLDARYVQLSVTDNDGTPPCVGELRLFAMAAEHAIPDRGADLSFEPQEEAAETHFTDNGVTASPLQILNAHGLNYVRLRLWVDPPPGYSNLASDLAMAGGSRRPATSSTWTSTIRTSGPILSIRSPRRHGRDRTSRS